MDWSDTLLLTREYTALRLDLASTDAVSVHLRWSQTHCHSYLMVYHKPIVVAEPGVLEYVSRPRYI